MFKQVSNRIVVSGQFALVIVSRTEEDLIRIF